MMRCSTCGERLDPGERRCPTCGAATSRRASGALLRVKRCPRCGYRGEGIGYFRRPGHVGLLFGIGLFTYGIGAIVYWLMRRKRSVCPNCGLGWEHARLRLEEDEEPLGVGAGESREGDGDLPRSGIFRRVVGVVAVLCAVFLIVLGVVDFEVGAVATGSVLGLAGSGSFWWGWKALQERRRAIMTGLQNRVLRLAHRKGGTLTVTDVAAGLNVSLPVAEKVLVGMDDGFRVRSEITAEGILFYEFPEVVHRRRLDSGEDPGEIVL